MLFDGAVKTARALHVSLDYLAGLTDDPRPAAALAAAEEDTVSSNGQAGQRDIPILEIAAAAGGGATVFDETVTGHVSFQRSWLDRHGIAPQHSVIIGVSGESMEPTLPDGCSILVDRSRRQPQEGHIYVLRTDEGLVVKRLRRDEAGQWQLQSEHPGWPAVPLASTAEVIGEVRWVARTL